MIEHLVGRALLGDHAVVHEDHAVGYFLGEAHLVRHDDGGHAVLDKVADQVEHLAHHLRVERRGRLVKEHDVRLHGQRAHDRDTLLLPAGERGRIHVCLVLQADTGE